MQDRLLYSVHETPQSPDHVYTLCIGEEAKEQAFPLTAGFLVEEIRVFWVGFAVPGRLATLSVHVQYTPVGR
jgi:hypothetical protein